MHFIIITRCYKPTNLEKVKESIKVAFFGSQHTYTHLLIVDLTHGGKRKDFTRFADDTTVMYFVAKKQANDQHLDVAMDLILTEFDQDDAYVFFVDDDNIMHPDFLQICQHCAGEDALVFKIEGRPNFGNPDALHGQAVGHIDWANFIVKLGMMKRVKIYHGGNRSNCEDSIFFNKMEAQPDCKIKFVDKVLAYYNKLPKP